LRRFCGILDRASLTSVRLYPNNPGEVERLAGAQNWSFLSDRSSGEQIWALGVGSLDNLVLVGYIRLTNRESLGQLLFPDSRVAQLSDVALVLAAYRKWGSKCPDHLDGDFSFVISDSLRSTFFVSVDHFASFPLYYWVGASSFVVASHPSLLFSIPGIPRSPNLNAVSEMAFCGQNGVSDAAETAHRGVFSLSPGTCLTVDESGMRQRTFWEPEVVPGMVPAQEGDAFEALRELLQAGVSNQMKGRRRIVSLLSGGLDSSAVTSLAAGFDGGKLITLSSVSSPLRQPRVPDETDFIQEFRRWPALCIELLDCAGRGPFDRLGEPERFQHSLNISSRQFLYEEFDSATRSHGADVILDGCFGEYTATNRGSGYHLELLLSADWQGVYHALKGKDANSKRVRGSFRRTMRTFGYELSEWVRPARQPHEAAVLLAKSFHAQGERPTGVRLNRDPRLWHRDAVRGWLSRHAKRTAVGADEIPRAFPLRTRSLVEFCISAPARMKVREGYSRYLIRKALDGILPKKIQWRTSKMPFCPDYYFRFNAQLGMARDFVRAIGPKDPVREVVDVSALSLLLEPVHPLQGSFDALLTIPSTLYLICFLRQFPEFRP
jgi:asparagine synthase (glutamine-hydrolysing)